ncbi:MAG: reverse transcriptase domain-containing protein, partial [Nostoc sp.]
LKVQVRQQIKSWLKSGVIDKGAFTATSEGTPQGGVISPLLANIALHGLENKLIQYAETLKLRYPNGSVMRVKDKLYFLTLIRYADDFIVLHENKAVVQR